MNAFGRGGCLWRNYVLVLVAVLGIAPHLWFSVLVGEPTYFKYAFDEDHYASLIAQGEHPTFYRLASSLLMRALIDVSGSVTHALMLADLLLPPVALLAAWCVARSLFADNRARAVFALGLVFSFDLLSFSNSSVVGVQTTHWPSLFHAPAWLIPNSEQSFLSLYRTPEPQVALPLFLFGQACLIRLLCLRPDATTGRWLPASGLLVASALLPFSYVMFAVAHFASLAVAASSLAFARHGRRESLMVFTALCVGGGVLMFLVLSADGPQGGGLLFPSRLPVVAASSVLAVILVALWSWQWARHRDLRPLAVYGLACAAFPLLIMNQQVVSGWMIGAKEWERTVNFPLIVMSVGVLLYCSRFSIRTWVAALVLPGCLGLMSVILVLATMDTFDAWRDLNLRSVATAALIDETPDLVDGASVVLEDAGMAGLVALRTVKHPRYVAAFTPLFLNPVSNVGVRSVEQHFAGNPHVGRLFEYLYRTETAPDAFIALLTRQAKNLGGFHIAFLFSFLDHWGPASDTRVVRRDVLLQGIPVARRMYEDYVQHPPQSVMDDAFVLTTGPVPADGRYAYTLVATRKLGPAVMSMYRQRFRIGPESVQFSPGAP